jgi:hypothetical protein
MLQENVRNFNKNLRKPLMKGDEFINVRPTVAN